MERKMSLNRKVKWKCVYLCLLRSFHTRPDLGFPSGIMALPWDWFWTFPLSWSEFFVLSLISGARALGWCWLSWLVDMFRVTLRQRFIRTTEPNRTPAHVHSSVCLLWEWNGEAKKKKCGSEYLRMPPPSGEELISYPVCGGRVLLITWCVCSLKHHVVNVYFRLKVF